MFPAGDPVLDPVRPLDRLRGLPAQPRQRDLPPGGSDRTTIIRAKTRNVANEHSVAEGLERTAGIITAAGSDHDRGVLAPFRDGQCAGELRSLASGCRWAVLLDSTIIRVVLVPASMKLMGHLNWWMPSFLAWVPEISEGGSEDEEEARGGWPTTPRASAVAVAPCCRPEAPLLWPLWPRPSRLPGRRARSASRCWPGWAVGRDDDDARALDVRPGERLRDGAPSSNMPPGPGGPAAGTDRAQAWTHRATGLAESA